MTDQKHESGAFFRELKRLNGCAPVSAYAGGWEHSKEVKADALLPIALAELGPASRRSDASSAVGSPPGSPGLRGIAMPSREIAAAAIACFLAGLAGASGDAAGSAPQCAPSSLEAGYLSRVTRALRSTEDVWGNELLASSDGPTYAGARKYLMPLLLAKSAQGGKLTASSVRCVQLSGPVGAKGADSMALHVADGSQIVSQRAAGRSLTFSVGADGGELYGSCIARLRSSRLANGYLPILETQYVDANGVRYRQESFATRIAQTRSLESSRSAPTRKARARARSYAAACPNPASLATAMHSFSQATRISRSARVRASSDPRLATTYLPGASERCTWPC